MTVSSSGQPAFVRPPVASALQMVASTDLLPGFALQNGTPNIISWTAPNDGQMHRVQVFGVVNTSSGETGGAISLSVKDPAGTTAPHQVHAGGAGVGSSILTALAMCMAPGSTVTLAQSSALTVGAALLFAELWAS